MSDKQFRAWVQTLPSCISGRYSEYLDSGEGRCVAAHVRRVATGSGTGIKGEYCMVPLTDLEHKMTHQHGETYFHPKEWWTAQAERYYRMWLRQG